MNFFMNQENINLPTDSELEILNILYEFGPQNVRFVNDEINKLREVGYTSTLKTMQIMMEKQMLHRVIIDRIHIYSPVQKEEETQRAVVHNLMEKAFRGNAASLVMNLLGNQETSKEELAQIKTLIETLENKK